MVPADSDGIPPVPPYSGSRFASFPFRLQASHLLRGAFPGASARFRIATLAALLPRRGLDPRGLGSSAFARHYSRNHYCSLLLPLLRCFSSRRSPRYRGARPSAARVPPFGHPRIKGHLRLPAAFRSLSRPSSPPRATGIPRAPFSFSFPHPRLPTGLLVFSVSRYVNELSRPPSPRRLSAPAAIPPVPGSPAPRVRLVVPSGVEPLTPTLSVWCSDQLSYETVLSNCPTLRVRNSKKLQE